MAILNGLYLLDATALPMVYGPGEQAAIARHVRMVDGPQTHESIARRPELLAHVDVLFTGWGSPTVDEAFLAAAPKLRAIFYGAGAVGGWITPAVWARGVQVTSAAVANAIPVAEYALATTLFSLKDGWALARRTRDERRFPDRDQAPGCFGTTVGLVSMGLVARAFARLLEPFDVDVVAYDPYLTDDDAARLNVELVGLEELFRRSHVVSLHSPELPETVGMITGRMIDSMRRGATFINTARGSIVREAEMVEVLSRRPDLTAVLDVAETEPPVLSSPLYTLPNVVLTPHIAGSVGDECRRMGEYMVAELERFVAGRPLKWAVTPAMAVYSSHRPRRTTDAGAIAGGIRPESLIATGT